jgi:hypothetical protein
MTEQQQPEMSVWALLVNTLFVAAIAIAMATSWYVFRSDRAIQAALFTIYTIVLLVELYFTLMRVRSYVSAFVMELIVIIFSALATFLALRPYL